MADFPGAAHLEYILDAQSIEADKAKNKDDTPITLFQAELAAYHGLPLATKLDILKVVLADELFPLSMAWFEGNLHHAKAEELLALNDRSKYENMLYGAAQKDLPNIFAFIFPANTTDPIVPFIEIAAGKNSIKVVKFLMAQNANATLTEQTLKRVVSFDGIDILTAVYGTENRNNVFDDIFTIAGKQGSAKVMKWALISDRLGKKTRAELVFICKSRMQDVIVGKLDDQRKKACLETLLYMTNKFLTVDEKEHLLVDAINYASVDVFLFLMRALRPVSLTVSWDPPTGEKTAINMATLMLRTTEYFRHDMLRTILHPPADLAWPIPEVRADNDTLLRTTARTPAPGNSIADRRVYKYLVYLLSRPPYNSLDTTLVPLFYAISTASVFGMASNLLVHIAARRHQIITNFSVGDYNEAYVQGALINFMAIFSTFPKDYIASDMVKYKALKGAVKEGHEEMVKYLLNAGAPLMYEVPGNVSWPMSIAAIDGKLEIMKMLYAAGSPLHVNGHPSPLELAVREEDEDAVQWLLDAGGSALLDTTNGAAIELALSIHSSRMLKLLLQYISVVSLNMTIKENLVLTHSNTIPKSLLSIAVILAPTNRYDPTNNMDKIRLMDNARRRVGMEWQHRTEIIAKALEYNVTYLIPLLLSILYDFHKRTPTQKAELKRELQELMVLAKNNDDVFRRLEEVASFMDIRMLPERQAAKRFKIGNLRQLLDAAVESGHLLRAQDLADFVNTV